MKKIFKKENLIFLLTIILCTLIVIYFDIQKETYDGDELYTYTLSTSAKGGFMGGNFPLDTFNNPDIINESLTLQREELFDLRTIYYNQVNDVHPPLYYFLFHYISIFSFNKFSKWPGLIYKIITKKHFNNPYIIYLTSGSIIYFLLVLKITPILSTRYIYNIYPIIEIVLCLLICNIIKNYKLPKIILTIIFIPLAYSNIFINEVSWCNQIPKEDTSVINTYKNYPYLYLANSDYDLTSKTFYARLFKEFYITYHIDEESINYITTYLKDNSYNGIVIDISNTIDQEKYLHEIASIMNYSKRIDTNLGIILESHP